MNLTKKVAIVTGAASGFHEDRTAQQPDRTGRQSWGRFGQPGDYIQRQAQQRTAPCESRQGRPE